MRWLLLLFAAIACGAVAGARIAASWGSQVRDLEQFATGPRVAP